MKKKISIAISGIGNRTLPNNKKKNYWIGWLNQIKKSKKYNLVAAHDILDKQLKRLIDQKILNTTQVYKNFDEMLKKEKLDAILISSPSRFHYGYIRKALKKNLYLLVEKPVVANFAQALDLMRLKRKKNISVIQNHNDHVI